MLFKVSVTFPPSIQTAGAWTNFPEHPRSQISLNCGLTVTLHLLNSIKQIIFPFHMRKDLKRNQRICSQSVQPTEAGWNGGAEISHGTLSASALQCSSYRNVSLPPPPHTHTPLVIQMPAGRHSISQLSLLTRSKCVLPIFPPKEAASVSCPSRKPRNHSVLFE